MLVWTILASIPYRDGGTCIRTTRLGLEGRTWRTDASQAVGETGPGGAERKAVREDRLAPAAVVILMVVVTGRGRLLVVTAMCGE